jgi:hypothetical protein
MILIGLGHRARQGKNTAALAMMQAVPVASHARLYAFGDALRTEVNRAIRQCRTAHNLVAQFQEAGIMPEWVEAVYEGKQRSILQWWGTDYRRKQDPEYWTSRLKKTFVQQEPDIAFVTDVRFPNEAAMIHELGGFVVRVTRTTPPDIEVEEHESERALDNYKGWDFHIDAADKTELINQSWDVYREIVRQTCFTG